MVRSPEMNAALALSTELIAELQSAGLAAEIGLFPKAQWVMAN
jgi:hypothetical protein